MRLELLIFIMIYVDSMRGLSLYGSRIWAWLINIDVKRWYEFVTVLGRNIYENEYFHKCIQVLKEILHYWWLILVGYYPLILRSDTLFLYFRFIISWYMTAGDAKYSTSLSVAILFTNCGPFPSNPSTCSKDLDASAPSFGHQHWW